MANLLYKKYKDRIFQIDFHRFHPSPKKIFKGYNGDKPYLPTLIENVMRKCERKSIGFDVFSSPFANLRDNNSYYFHFQPSVIFSDICRGYIFIKPVKGLSRCTWIKDFINNEIFIKYKSYSYWEARFRKKFNDVNELNKFLNDLKGK